MSNIIEQQITRNIAPRGWGAKRIWLAMIRCPVWDFDGNVLRIERATGCHPEKAEDGNCYVQ